MGPTPTAMEATTTVMEAMGATVQPTTTMQGDLVESQGDGQAVMAGWVEETTSPGHRHDRAPTVHAGLEDMESVQLFQTPAFRAQVARVRESVVQEATATSNHATKSEIESAARMHRRLHAPPASSACPSAHAVEDGLARPAIGVGAGQTGSRTMVLAASALRRSSNTSRTTGTS